MPVGILRGGGCIRVQAGFISIPANYFSPFLPLVYRAGEDFYKDKGLMTEFTKSVISAYYPYSGNIILLALSISCGGNFYLSRFMHLILWLYYLGLWNTLQTLSFLSSVWGRDSRIKVHAIRSPLAPRRYSRIVQPAIIGTTCPQPQALPASEAKDNPTLE